MVSEKRLVRRLQQGDAQAFAEFVDAYGAQVHHLVKRYVDNPSDAEDVTQEIFCDLHRCVGKFRGESSLATWVYRVALNHCLKHCQKHRADTVPLRLLDDQDMPNTDWRADPARCAVHSEMSAQLRDAVAQLSPLHSDVVVLCELHGLTYQECAAALGIPVGTVKSRLFTAFRRLRVLLSGYVTTEEDTAPSRPAASVKEATR
jgi:RNA polymerase sigma-70 factor (ECF subfamily)